MLNHKSKITSFSIYRNEPNIDTFTIDDVLDSYKTPTGGAGNPDAAKAAADAAAAKAASDAQAATDAATAQAAKDKAAADASAASKPVSATIDGKEYKLNENGDALNEDGTVFKTSAELTPPTTFIQQYINELGFEILDEDGQPKVYEDTTEGIIAYNKDVVQWQVEQAQEDLLNEAPSFRRYYQAMRSGMTEEQYFNSIVKNDFTGLKIDDKTPDDVLTNIVIKGFVESGMKESEAADLAKMFADTGKLKAKAIEAEDKLKTIVAQREQDNIAANQARQEADIKAHNDYWNGVKEAVITTGKVNGIIIPVADREPFFNYLAVPVENNLSQEMIEARKMSLEQRLMEKFMRYKGYDFNKLIRDKVNEHKTQSLTERIKANQKGILNTGTTAKPNSTPNINEMTIDNLINSYKQ